MSDHDHVHHDPAPPSPGAATPAGPETPDDSGSQALSEALKSSFAIVKVVMGALVLLFLASGIFTVGPQEKAIILRFGSPQGEPGKELLGAGLHWSFPYPIDEVVKIPITEIQQVRSTVGWYATTPEQEFNNMEPPPGPSLNPASDGYTITGDGNIIHTRATLSYRIERPSRYALEFVNASNAVQNALDNALIFVTARYAVDDVLTRDKTGFRERVQARVEELIRKEDLGIAIEQCVVESKPPRQCKQAFDAVLTSVSVRDTAHNEAVKYENQMVSLAAAEAAGRTNAAEAGRVQLVRQVKAEADQFTELLPRYRSNPSLFATVLLSEKLTQVMTNLQDKYYVPEGVGGEKSELRLQFSREPLKPAAPPPSR
jgi:modulator of FtsH protease HflK